MQGGFDAIDHQGMAGIVSALKTHNTLRTFSEPVHQFAFALVAPLGTYNDNVTSFDHVHIALFFNHFDNPLRCNLYELAVALEFIDFTVVAGQDAHHGFALLTKL